MINPLYVLTYTRFFDDNNEVDYVVGVFTSLELAKSYVPEVLEWDKGNTERMYTVAEDSKGNLWTVEEFPLDEYFEAYEYEDVND